MISRSLGIVCYYRWIFSDGHENYFKDWCLMNSQLVFLISTSFQFSEIVILSKGRKPDKFESQLKFEKQKVETLWNLALPVFEVYVQISLDVNFSLNQTLFTFLLYVRQTWMTQLVLAIFLWGVIFLQSERIPFLIHGLAVYEKKRFLFTRDLSLENSLDSYLCFWLALFHSVSYFFLLYRSPSSSSCMVFDAIWSNIGEVLSIILSG